MPSDTKAYAEALEAVENITPFALKRVVDDAKSANLRTTEPTVAFFASVSDGTNREFVKVSEVRSSDLYAFSDAPIIELLNAISVLRNKVDQIDEIPVEDIEFELQSLELWRLVGAMKRFFGVSPAHDEMISTLRTLGVGENALLTKKKLGGLRSALGRVADRIVLSDDTLDDLCSDLEESGFDTDAAMAFAQLE